MSAVVNNKLFLYAENSGILVSGTNKQYIEQLLTEYLNCLSQWLIDNKLSHHLGTTESFLVGSPQKIKCNPSLEIICNNLAIKSTTSVNYLGATLDQTFPFSEMVQLMLKKVNARLKFVYRNKQYLTQHTNTLLVMSLIQCHYDYAGCIWYTGLNKVLKNEFQTTQNKLIRFVLYLEFTLIKNMLNC